MSAAALTWRKVPDAIDRLAKGDQHAATVAYRAYRRRERDGTLDETATDAALGEESGWSASLLQKGAHALDVLLGKLGCPLIGRRSGLGMHGRRQITLLPLAGEGKSEAADAGLPPGPPSSETRDTTISGGSSSSSIPGPGPPLAAVDPALVARACALIPKATPGRVVDAVANHDAEWVARALDRVEERNRQPGNKPVRSWGFVLGILSRWRKEGGPPPPDQAPKPQASPRPAQTIEETAAEDIRNARIRAAWDALDEERRQSLRNAVLKDSPHLIRWPRMIEAECLARIERAMVDTGELIRAP